VLDLVEVGAPVERAVRGPPAARERYRVAEALAPVGEVPHDVIALAVEVAARAREVARAAHPRVAAAIKDALALEHLLGERLLRDRRYLGERRRRLGEIRDVIHAHRAR